MCTITINVFKLGAFNLESQYLVEVGLRAQMQFEISEHHMATNI
jgi:hypothetical protein